jgi:carboxylate-amine ligase
MQELGSLSELSHIEQILKHGTGADRQLAVWEQTGGDLKAVVDHIIEETYRDLRVPQPAAVTSQLTV